MNQPPQTYILTEISQTIAFGAIIGALLLPTDLVLLSGGLGAGKTHLTKGIIAGMGSSDVVTSPTYIFINEYRLAPRGVAFHVDLYRIEDSSELASIGLDDALTGHGACIIEWPEREVAAQGVCQGLRDQFLGRCAWLHRASGASFRR